MWKIRIDYSDGSQLTITGKHKDIPLRLARKYQENYRCGKATYQQYPKKDYPAVDLAKKIEELEGMQKYYCQLRKELQEDGICDTDIEMAINAIKRLRQEN